MKSSLAYDHLADVNNIEVCGEIVSFPIVSGKGEQAKDISVDEYIQLAWKAVLDTATSYGVTGEAKYNYYFFPNAQQSFKNQFYYAFNGDTAAADKAFNFFTAATANPDTTAQSRRKMKGSPSSSHMHVILKAILFLTKVMNDTNGKDEFYPMVVLDIYNNPIPVIERGGQYFKLVSVKGKIEERLLSREEEARKTHTFLAFAQIFTQLIKQNRVQEFGSWTGLPSRLYALGEMVKVRQIQYKRTVQITHNLKRQLEQVHGSTEGLKARIQRMVEEEARLNLKIREQSTELAQESQDIQGLRVKIQELQGQLKESKDRDSQVQGQTRQQLMQNEAAYQSALKAKESEFSSLVNQKEDAIRLLKEEVLRNRAQIEELERTQQTSPTKADNRASAGVNSQFALLQRTNERLSADLGTHSGVIAEQTKQINGLTRDVAGLKADNEKLASANEKLEAENGVLVRALQNFFEFIMSWFQAAPESLRDCLNVEGVPNAKKGTTFAEVLQPKMGEVTSLLNAHGVVTSFGAATTEVQADQSQAASSQLFSDMQFKNK